jgi:hypothetical protein
MNTGNGPGSSPADCSTFDELAEAQARSVTFIRRPNEILTHGEMTDTRLLRHPSSRFYSGLCSEQNLLSISLVPDDHEPPPHGGLDNNEKCSPRVAVVESIVREEAAFNLKNEVCSSPAGRSFIGVGKSHELLAPTKKRHRCASTAVPLRKIRRCPSPGAVAWDHCAAYQKPVNPKFNIVFKKGMLGLGHDAAPILTQSNPSLEQPITLTNFQEADHKRLSTLVTSLYEKTQRMCA